MIDRSRPALSTNEAAVSAFRRGCDLQAAGDRPAAITHYRTAIDLDATDPRFWIAFGQCLSELHHWDEAIRALTRGIALKPHYCEADARLMLAEALYGAGRLRDARTQWDIVSRMQPEYPSYDLPMQEARQRLAASQR
ncbi:tetratricopeptide repeat protein [Bradyrhizobium sp. U87765 SZCCT0131]|uniref:tetratricopeptide repeat protein n=1 Tax=unclassified Bradyrhizobium TaxID=2631580 RepID=UPI001BA4A26D|nr:MULTISPECIES: tetratricopeptide repeat protein [unclassified Bradyrhizobium]MBR1219262.1 tetratricopeptide repeat protein [Bradyrhizobium sp. U87765 SZCCT0131]MBR1261913.1 tetratricopeptide repeat protein [Bradyrhizobium sp. U87765 SZCCT0134]MBR1306234.1 tetratricopeptide repeat protein [Bradyrhizobium sp. U87765 SZCCT0110]MBR1317695.1 tetratricopeptide repeat protein [Bradyrhizobium sp. U87765 SZCCT0109]MBR1351397.1 tetratricopeptide repeat protein [Bradyrhizobium sp. U87765 SZCCT0048]